MGTPDFSVPSLEALLAAGYDVAAVYTQPDRPRGRGRRLTFSPVKKAAVRAGLPVYQPQSLRSEAVTEQLRQIAPDAIVVVAFGQLLPKAVLDLPPLGCINVHASLLPRHRGAAPIQAALAAGDAVTGVTTMFMDEGLDTGDMILKREVPIGPEDDAGVLHDRLAAAGAELLVQTMEQLAAGTAPRHPQDDESATYAPRLTKEDALLRWSEPAAAVVNHVRAFAPRPGAFTWHRGRAMKVLAARLFATSGDKVGGGFSPVYGAEEGGTDGSSGAKPVPGTVVDVVADGVVVATGEGRVLLTRVQPPGKGPMSGRDYANGFRLQPGETFGDAPEGTDG